MSTLFTSESVSEGHPDKVCDAVSDALLDLHLEKDPCARTAIETMATTNRIIIAGETSAAVCPDADEIETAIRRTVKTSVMNRPDLTGKCTNNQSPPHSVR